MTHFRRHHTLLLRTSLIAGTILICMSPASADRVSFTKPLDQLTGMNERPLFAPSRRPVQHAATPEAPPADTHVEPLAATLLGVVSGDDGSGLAILKVEGETDVARIHIGESVGGWQLDRVESHAAIFTNGDQTTTLAFPTANQDGGNTAQPAPNTNAATPVMPDQVAPP